MFAGNWLTFGIARRSVTNFPIASTGLFGLGMFLGTLAVSMWQQWSLAFGLDPVFLLAVAVVVSLALWLGQREWVAQGGVTPGQSLAYSIWCISAWSLLHPFWIDAMTTLMRVVPMSLLENPTAKPVLALAVAVLGWLIPGILWSATITHATTLLGKPPSSTRRSFSFVICGIASGLLLNSLVLAPWMGVFIPTVAASILAASVGCWIRRIPVNSNITLPTKTIGGSKSVTTQASIRVAMACLVGGLLACNLRLVNQLMPHAAFVIFVQVAGVMVGLVCGLALASFRRSHSDRAAWGGLFAAAASSLLIAVQPSLVDFSLWMNSSLTNIVWLMMARTLLLVVTAFPFGAALAWIADSAENHEYRGGIAWGTPFLAGLASATFLLGGTVGVVPLMAGIGGLLVVASGYVRVRSLGWVASIRTAIVAGCLLAVALSLPMWSSHDDASRTAKLLFSTPAFVAYRSGWDIEHLSALDDLRLIHRHEGSSGSLTLWRGRVAELYVREAGVPRSVLTKNPQIVPQFAPEVLQAVYSLVLSDRPSRVLLLGLSAGVPLSTCLEFPIREAVCVEGDSSLIDLVRGPLTRETGIDPLIDDRVTLQRISPELALMTRETEPFDVILSSPPSSSMTGGASAFTREFYQRASNRLAERGLFCQRFECVDYGPEPLRIVLKSMRQSFRQVIAIETAAGELLLFGANADDVFIPSELATRLELPHVLRILARSGLDWSTLLNQPSYDHEALAEVCDDSRSGANSIFNGLLAARAPMEVMRWGNKQQEVQAVLTTTRLSKAPFWTDATNGQPNLLEEEIHLSRRSRLVEWLGDNRVSLELLRRLNEVTAQQKLVYENPDAHWWEYRKTLRQQLQDRPRTVVQQIKAIDEKPTLHPEDVRRRDYFVALGNAARRPKPTRAQIAAVEEYLEPYDPLLSYFARQEVADMLSRCDEDAALELAYRLHVIFFAPTRDASVRNVATALETLVKHPEAVPDESSRFDTLNGLIQTLRTRWETRQFISQTSSKKVLDDVDQSLIAVEKSVMSLDELATSAGVTDAEWQTRKQVIDRLLLRPLRSYRDAVKTRQTRSQTQARAIFENAESPDFESKK